jgi:hypothetical protein
MHLTKGPVCNGGSDRNCESAHAALPLEPLRPPSRAQQRCRTARGVD